MLAVKSLPLVIFFYSIKIYIESIFRHYLNHILSMRAISSVIISKLLMSPRFCILLHLKLRWLRKKNVNYSALAVFPFYKAPVRPSSAVKLMRCAQLLLSLCGLALQFALGLIDDVEILLITRESQDQAARVENAEIGFFPPQNREVLLEEHPREN